jgi:hypothetical protein
MEIFSGCGGWYRGRGNGKGALVPLRWVYTHDPQTAKDDWFFSTDPAMAANQIVECFAGRWSIEVTFEEVRAHLGWETTRQWCRRSVLRMAPCLLGLFSIVTLLFIRMGEPVRRGGGGCDWAVHQTPGYRKTEPTFADALYAVRRMIWERCMLRHVLGPRHVKKLPPRFKRTLLTYLAEAA